MSITDAKYVSLTTLRRSGEAVSSPVWIAPLGDGTAGFTTDLGSGKVKRIRNNPEVTLRPCSASGKVAEGAEEVRATASVVTGAEAHRIAAAIKRKYGLMVTVIGIGHKLSKVFRRKPEPTETGIVLTFS